jgi:hypothetical protein
MKKYIQAGLIVLLLFLSGNYARAQSDSTGSIIYFIRTKNFPYTPGSGLLVNLIQDSRGYNVFIDSEFICSLNQHSFISHEIKPGDHHLSVRLNSRKFNANILQLQMNVGDQKVYYIEVAPGYTKFNSPLECHMLPDSLGSKLILNLKEDENCKTKKS